MIFTEERQIIRFLHTGDWHLDSPFCRLPLQKSEERRTELRQTVSAVMALIRERQIDLALLPGDLFDSAYVTSKTVSFLLDEFAACPQCQFVIAPGNHDPYTTGSLWRSGRLPENVHVFATEALAHFDFPALNTAVYGWAFLSDRLENAPLAGAEPEDAERLNLLCAHGDLGVPLSKYAPISQQDLAGFGAAYAALGHQHIATHPTAIGNGGLYAYTGCLVGRSFDEPGRGGVILGKATCTEKGWEIQTERIEMATRRYETLTVDLTGVDSDREVAGRLKAAVQASGYGADTVLRVTLTGSTPPDFDVPQQADGSVLGLYHLELIDHTIPNYDARYLEKDMTVRGELYRSLLPDLTAGTAEERRNATRALRMGLAALEGNDITQL